MLDATLGVWSLWSPQDVLSLIVLTKFVLIIKTVRDSGAAQDEIIFDWRTEKSRI